MSILILITLILIILITLLLIILNTLHRFQSSQSLDSTVWRLSIEPTLHTDAGRPLNIITVLIIVNILDAGTPIIITIVNIITVVVIVIITYLLDLFVGLTPKTFRNKIMLNCIIFGISPPYIISTKGAHRRPMITIPSINPNPIRPTYSSE